MLILNFNASGMMPPSIQKDKRYSERNTCKSVGHVMWVGVRTLGNLIPFPSHSMRILLLCNFAIGFRIPNPILMLFPNGTVYG